MPADSTAQTFKVDETQAIPLRDIRQILPNQPSLRTLTRWRTEGSKNRNTNQMVKLPAIRNASGYHATTLAAFQWFIERLNDKE